MPFARLALPVLLATLLGACLSKPTAEAWLTVGFHSPGQTFGTFQTALRADQPSLEYRCFGQAMKEREGITEVLYREFRDRLFSRQPWLKRAACARIVEVQPLGPGRERVIARVDTVFVDKTFAVDFVREDFYELRAGESLLEDGFTDFERLVAEDGDALLVRLPLPWGAALTQVSEVRVGREWKIDGFVDVTEP